MDGAEGSSSTLVNLPSSKRLTPGIGEIYSG